MSEDKQSARMAALYKTFFHDSVDTAHLLKAHLFAERLLDELILSRFGADSSAVERLDLRFAQKVSLAENLLLLPPECAESFRKLNKLRNACAHTLHAAPTMAQVVDVLGTISKDIPDLLPANSIEVLLNRFMSFLCGYLFPDEVAEQALPPVSVTRFAPAAYAPAAPEIPER